MRARRALLYMPGDDIRKIQKAAASGVDCVCMDMEDGVALSRKAEARQVIVQALQTLDFGRSERLARINAVSSGFETDDLAVVLPAHPQTVVVPKVEEARQVAWVDEMITRSEAQHGWAAGEIGLLVGVETARGIVNLKEIASASPRLQGLIFGAEDFAGDVGAVRTPEAWEVFYARSALVTHAAAFDLQAIDMVYIDFHDTEGLRREAEAGARLAFSGKQIIHPNQIAPVHAAFTPSPAQIEYALRVRRVFDEQQAIGKGAFALDGKMIDAPIIKAAERVLSAARAAGQLDGV
ncbi:MAG: HpcH/HpaI aldolase/citrate lyase family protein [Chloroflexota bacterium]